jgi:hypothetical protein
MPTTTHPRAAALLDMILEHIDIPRSYYEKAVTRHKSFGEWLCRPESPLVSLNPHVSTQGSFRYGTVVRPVHEGAEYDLDNVTTLQLAKTAMTQRQLKELYGSEVIAYAKAHNMIEPVQEKHRCWRLMYADEVNFHMDSLPCVPEDRRVILALVDRGVPMELAQRTVAITDRRHPLYEQITADLLSSNPRGFARWFETRVRAVAETRMRELVLAKKYASVDAVPAYEWKTPLQRVIQLLKRHRDVMFRHHPADAPISMIITNLAAHAYTGATNLVVALQEVVAGMPSYVSPARPRVPNPADPREDYADKWSKDANLERHFWLWHTQVAADVERLRSLFDGNGIEREVRELFDVNLTRDDLKILVPAASAAPAVISTAPSLYVTSAPRPWGR